MFQQNRARIPGTLHNDQYTFLSYLAHFFSKRETFRKKLVGKIKTNILHSITSFLDNRTVYEIIMGKFCRAGQTTIGNMAHAYYMLDN